ncbi:MAG: hypothetical protein E7258_04980 [Lachnospiraceae bacterium]|nr:hypothetical protein [Lachnospiraceae bacterium]
MEEKEIVLEELDKDNSEIVKKKNILDWYDEKRNIIFTVFYAFSGLLFAAFFMGIFINVDGGFLIGKFGMPEFDAFYKTWVDKSIHAACMIDMAVAIMVIIMYFFTKTSFEDKMVHGVWLYNIVLAVETFLVGKHLFTAMFFFGRFPFLGILYVPFIVSAIVVIVLNTMHYLKNKGSYAPGAGYAGYAIVITLFAVIAIVTSVGIFKQTKKDIREAEDNYANKVFWETNGIINLHRDGSIMEDEDAYIGIKYVNLYNERGRIYTPEEMDEAIYNLKEYGGNDHYCGDSWYAIVEFNADVEAIEEKNDFSQYSYKDEVDPDYDIYRWLVQRRLDMLGQRGFLSDGFDQEEVDAACEYVYDMLKEGKPIEELGASGEEITITFTEDIKAGTKGFYNVDVDYEKTYANISGWSRVAYGGSDVSIEAYQPYRDSDFTFEEGCVYRAKINIYPELTYCFNKDMKIEVKGIDCSDIEYEYNDNYAVGPYYTVTLWLTMGDDITLENVDTIDTVNITGTEGVKLGDDISEAQKNSTISLDDNLLLGNFYWCHYAYSEYTGSYFTYCNPDSGWDDSVTEFTHDYPVFQMEFTVYADTGHIFGEDLNVTYNGKELVYGETEKHVPDAQIAGYYTGDEVENITVGVRFYGITFQGEHGTITANYDFATEGTTIILTPVPDEGYRFVGYEATHGLTITPGDPEINIVDNQFVMKDYPVVITGIFEAE